MDSDESDNYNYSDTEIDDKKHSKLIDDVLHLNKIQQLKKPSRTEPTSHISEFNLVKSTTGNKGSIELTELTQILKKRKKHAQIEGRIKSTAKTLTLPKPLEKPQADRIRRTVSYEKSRLDFDKWEATVESNRAASHISFPLKVPGSLKIIKKNTENFAQSTFRIKSKLQQELEELEGKVEEYHVNVEDVEQEEFNLTEAEVQERRKEQAKLRAHMNYKESKARRQNKIKSKKFHRIQRREKIKLKLKEFEDLQKTNPEEAIKKLEDIEKARAEERFSLRHKGTGQWARNKQVRAKYDKESRQVLAQQLAISRDLTQKVKTGSDGSDEEGEHSIVTDESNPWVSSATIKPNNEVTDFVTSYRKYWNEKNNVVEEEIVVAKKKKETIKSNKQETDKKLKKERVLNPKRTSLSTSEWEVSIIEDDLKINQDVEEIFNKLEDQIELKLKRKGEKIKNTLNTSPKKTKIKPKKATANKKSALAMPARVKKAKIDEPLLEKSLELERESQNEQLQDLQDILSKRTKTVNATESNSNIDPNRFIKAKATTLNTAIADLLTESEENEQNGQRNIIMEAFEDDDIVADFNAEKSKEIDKDKPKDIDLNLPGWGSWGGTNIAPDQRKRKRFIIKMPQDLPRRDDNKGELIINENVQKKMKAHLVSEVPFPFKSVKDYEASVRAPIGNTFVPEMAFKKLIRPAVSTKMGAIIAPISRDMVVTKRIQ